MSTHFIATAQAAHTKRMIRVGQWRWGAFEALETVRINTPANPDSDAWIDAMDSAIASGQRIARALNAWLSNAVAAELGIA